MKEHITRRAPARNKTNDVPDLFSWRSAPPRNVSRAAFQISKRFGLSLDHVTTIAHLAGVGIDGGSA
jgi:hypothetical protein